MIQWYRVYKVKWFQSDALHTYIKCNGQVKCLFFPLQYSLEAKQELDDISCKNAQRMNSIHEQRGCTWRRSVEGRLGASRGTDKTGYNMILL